MIFFQLKNIRNLLVVKNRVNISRYLYFAIIWGVIATIFTLLPSNNIPYSKYISIYNLDFIVHFGIFLILSFLLLIGILESSFNLRHSPLLIVFVMSFTYGLLLELIQILIPSRGFELMDLIGDTFGTIIGLLFGHLFKHLKSG